MKKIIIFGTGKMYNLYKSKLSNIEIVAFLDNDKEKQGSQIDGIPVYSPELANEIKADRIYIIASYFIVRKMYEQLIHAGISSEKIYYIYDIADLPQECKKVSVNYEVKKGINVLLCSDNMELSGAQKALLNAGKVLKKRGYHVVIASPDGGRLEADVKEAEIQLIIDERFRTGKLRNIEWIEAFDFIIINTVLNYHLLLDRNLTTPIIWWLHETDFFYQWIIPYKLQQINKSNLHVCAVSCLAKKPFINVREDIDVGSLLVYVEESAMYKKQRNKQKIVFAVIGVLCELKGQDILLNAVNLLTKYEREQIEVWLIGRQDPEFMSKYKQGFEDSHVIKLFGELPKDRLEQLYAEIDVVICSSRSENLCMAVLEGAAHCIMPIISTAAAISEYFTDNQDSLFFLTENETILAKKMSWCIAHQNQVIEMGEKSHEVYRKYFSETAFEKNLQRIIDGVLPVYRQEDYVYREFYHHFYQFRQEPIILYGIGINTGNLLRHITDYNILGLMDGKQKSGEIWGKRILDECDVIESGAKLIIIVARSAVIGTIYHRIEKFTRENEIRVYDIHGNDLKKRYQDQGCSLPYYHLCGADLKRECEIHDIITFDIFDTLIVRKTLYPTDVFQLVERALANEAERIENFCNARMKAEDRCYKRGINPTIDQIYDEIQLISGISNEIRDKYMDMELETERSCIVPREWMLNLFNEIKEYKPVYLVSDMYLPKAFIEELLAQCGYKGYTKIFISNEYGCSKRDGLFDFVLKEISIERKTKNDLKILHIGDDEDADEIAPKALGINTFRILSGRELLGNSAYHKLADQKRDLFENIMIGLFCQRAFDNPFIFYGQKGKLALEDHRLLSGLFCAPVIVLFAIWAVQQIRKEDIDFILYTARDSYILEILCKMIDDGQNEFILPKGVYTYVSRRAMHSATVYTAEDIQRVASYDFHGTAQELLQKRFHVDTIPTQRLYGDDNELVEHQHYLELLLKENENSILASCEQERNNYKKYLASFISDHHKRIACFDFIAAGSIHNGLRKLLPDKEIIGLYFQKKKSEEEEIERHLKVSSFYESKGEFELDNNLFRYYLFLEMLLTSPEPTFDHMDDNAKPIFMEESRTPKDIALIIEMQDEVIKYARDLISLYPRILDVTIETSLADLILGFMGKEYTDIRIEQILNMMLADEYIAKKFNIFDRI